MPKSCRRRIDLLRQGAGHDEIVGGGTVARQHAVADEPVAHSGHHRDLAHGLRQPHGGGQHILSGGGAAHHLEQAHHIGGTEEMQADDILRAAREFGDLIQIQRGGIRGQDRSRLHHGIQVLENLALDLHVLEHRLDAQIHAAKRGIFQRRRDQRQAPFEAGLVERALAQCTLVIAADIGKAAIEGVLLGLQQHHGQAGIDQAHGDAAPHGAGADHADFADGSHRRVIGHIENMRRRPLGLKYVPQRRRLGRQHESGEQFPLPLQALLEGHLDGRRHRLHTGGRRGIGAGDGLDRIARELEKTPRRWACSMSHRAPAGGAVLPRSRGAQSARRRHASRPPRRRRTEAFHAACRRPPWHRRR